MIMVNIVQAGSSVQAVVNGKVRATGANATAVIKVVAKAAKANQTIWAPKAMAQPMKAGDILSRGDINSVAAPAYVSRKQ